jgi:hypothetical protein
MGRDRMKPKEGRGVRDSIEWDEMEWALGARRKRDETRTEREEEVTAPSDVVIWEEIKQNTDKTRKAYNIVIGLCIVSVM